MNDNDTKEKVYTGVRAANTVSTLKPRDIYEASGNGRTATISEGVADSLGLTIDEQGAIHAKPPSLSEQLKRFLSSSPKETVYEPEEFGKPEIKLAPRSAKPEPPTYGATKTVLPHFGSIGNLVSPSPKPADQKPMDERVLRLEELVDGLLDRIAIYNTRSNHKI